LVSLALGFYKLWGLCLLVYFPIIFSAPGSESICRIQRSFGGAKMVGPHLW